MKLVSGFSLAAWIALAAFCLFANHYFNGWGDHCLYHEYEHDLCD